MRDDAAISLHRKMYCYHNSPGVNTLKEIATSFHFVSKIRDDKRGVFVIINIILSLGKTAFMASPPKATKSSKECKAFRRHRVGRVGGKTDLFSVVMKE